jgi:actin-related protein
MFKCDPIVHPYLIQTLVLTGGNSMFPDLNKRILSELPPGISRLVGSALIQQGEVEITSGWIL